MACGSLSRLAAVYSDVVAEAIENPLPGKSPPCGLSSVTARVLLRVLEGEGNARRCQRLSQESTHSAGGPARWSQRR